jgi:hypothetical protein
MIRVTYLSQEAQQLSSKEMLALLTKCHQNNTAKGITGMLLYGNGTFLQALEGEKALVEALMAKITTDPRHSGINVLKQETITKRHYTEWSMGFEWVTEKTLAEIPSLRNFGLGNFNAEYMRSHDEVTERLLERHRAPHWDPLIRELDARDNLIKELREKLTHARNNAEMAALVLESVAEVAKVSKLDDAHLNMVLTTLRSLR